MRRLRIIGDLGEIYEVEKDIDKWDRMIRACYERDKPIRLTLQEQQYYDDTMTATDWKTIAEFRGDIEIGR